MVSFVEEENPRLLLMFLSSVHILSEKNFAMLWCEHWLFLADETLLAEEQILSITMLLITEG